MTRVPLGRDLRLGAWWFALGGTAGALMGMLVGGVGGRLLMLLLRATSPEFAGSLSDDGFEIGVVTHRTLQLLLTTAQIGALNGIGYVAARPFLSRRWRLPAWTLVGAAVGGSQIVHADGVDFALQPQWLAVGSFVALPAAGAAAIAWLAERWSRVPPWTRTRRTVLAGATAPLGAVGFALALPFALAALALARLEPLRNATRNHGAVGAALLLAAIAAVAGYDLARDVQAIL